MVGREAVALLGWMKMQRKTRGEAKMMKVQV
jgi:hypothetical protein